jgi:hypothetical protein
MSKGIGEYCYALLGVYNGPGKCAADIIELLNNQLTRTSGTHSTDGLTNMCKPLKLLVDFYWVGDAAYTLS